MTIDKHLKDLVENNRRIIIPDLGAFLTKEGEGQEKSLIFSSFLKYNDGFLEKYVGEKDGISQQEGAEQVKQFVEEVNKTVKARKNYEIPGLGYFYMDDRGSVAFQSKAEEAKEKATVASPAPAKAGTAEPVKPATTKTVPATTPATEKNVEKVEASQPATRQTTATATNSSTRTVNSSYGTSTAKREYAAGKESTPPPPPKKKSNNGLLITIIILLLVIILLFASYFVIPSVKEKVDSLFGLTGNTTQVDDNTTGVSQPLPQVADSADITKQPTADSTSQQVSKKDTNTAPTGSKPASTTQASSATTSSNVTPTSKDMYYVIVGTFEQQGNAEKLYKECVADGYSAELLPKMGPLYPVSIFKSTDRAESMKVYREAKAKFGDAWVYKPRR